MSSFFFKFGKKKPMIFVFSCKTPSLTCFFVCVKNFKVGINVTGYTKKTCGYQQTRDIQNHNR